MLGSPCSPCCGCTPDALKGIYDTLAAKTCRMTLTGRLPKFDAATFISPGYGAASFAYTRDEALALFLDTGISAVFYKANAMPSSIDLALDLSQSSFSLLYNDGIAVAARGRLLFVYRSNPLIQASWEQSYSFLIELSTVFNQSVSVIPNTQCFIYSVASGHVGFPAATATWRDMSSPSALVSAVKQSLSGFDISVTEVAGLGRWLVKTNAPYFVTGDIGLNFLNRFAGRAAWPDDIRSGEKTYSIDALQSGYGFGQQMTAEPSLSSFFATPAYPERAFALNDAFPSRVWHPYQHNSADGRPAFSSDITSNALTGFALPILQYTAAAQAYGPDPVPNTLERVEVTLS